MGVAPHYAEGICSPSVRLTVCLIAQGKFYWPFEEIPESVAVPGGALQYVVPDEHQRDVPKSPVSSAPVLVAKRRHTHAQPR